MTLIFARPHKRKGFTLLELTTTIIVIAVLAAIAIPTFSGVITRSNKAAALSSAQNFVEEAKALYMQDNNVTTGPVTAPQVRAALEAAAQDTPSITTDAPIPSEAAFLVTSGDQQASIDANTGEITITTIAAHGSTCATGGSCAIGDTGPGGGIVYYISPTSFTETGAPCASSCKYLEMAPGGWDAPTSLTDPHLAWSSDLSTVVGATGLDLGTGLSNTTTMYNSGNSPAADAVHNYHGGGRSDWFIAAAGETTGLYDPAVYTLAAFTFPEITWTSTENNAGHADYLNWVAGWAAGGSKNDGTPQVRPVRAF